MADEEVNEMSNEHFYKKQRARENEMQSENESFEKLPEYEMSEYKPIIDHLSTMLKNILSDLRSKQEPDQILTMALGGLTKIQQEQFVLENILESLKKGEDLTNISSRLERLGLLPSEFKTEPIPDDKNVPDPKVQQERNWGAGKFFRDLLKKLKKPALLLLESAMSAAKAAGKFVEVTPIIGFVGPVPTVSLKFESKGASVEELIKMLEGFFQEPEENNAQRQ